MTAYIKGATLISPQQTFPESGLPSEFRNKADAVQLKCIEPVYRDFLDPMASRRMSRIVKMGVCAALKCMKNSNVEVPDAIITGTGLGCLEDTEKFLSSIYSNNEKLLNPTPFIQSTHNTVAGAIALAVKCHGYNATYTHRGFSFESAVLDALMQLNDNPGLSVLTGSFDELTESSYLITKRLGLWRNGSIPGEGVAFFMLGGSKGENDLAAIRSLSTFYTPEMPGISDFPDRMLPDLEKIDVVLMGISGDRRNDQPYLHLLAHTFKEVPCAEYKSLCGEFDTSSSFALWLATMMIKEQRVSSELMVNQMAPKKIQTVLIYNHLHGKNHSLFVLEKC